MNISKLEEELEKARKQFPGFSSEKWDEWMAASKAVAALENKLSKARMAEYVKTRVFPLKDFDAQIPHLLHYKYNIFIMFPLAGKLEADSFEQIALVQFKQWKTSDFRYSSNLKIRGRPFLIEGLEPLTVEIVENSALKADIESVFQSLPNYDPESWRLLEHYVIELPAEMGRGLRVSEISFEKHRLFTWISVSLPMTLDCIAQFHSVEIYKMNMLGVMSEITKNIFEEKERA